MDIHELGRQAEQLGDKAEREMICLLELAGITVKKHWRLENCYWPSAYVLERAASPWLLVQTPNGMIKMGHRKRVLSIDWSDTDVRGEVTQDEVTKDDTMVHAWTTPKALEYLTELAKRMRESR